MECKVCLAADAGLHYKTNTCQACAAFFRRTVHKKLRYKCVRNEQCDVTYNDPSTSFDFHFDTTSDVFHFGDVNQEEEEFYTLENVLGDQKKFLQEIQKRFRKIFQRKSPIRSNLPFSLSLCQQFAVARKNFARKWPNCTKDKIFYDGMYDFNKGWCDFYKVLEYSAQFCMDIDNFSELSLDQKFPVFKHFLERFFQMDRVFVTTELLGNDLNDSRVVAVSGEIVDFSTCHMNVAGVTNMTEEEFRTIVLISEHKVKHLFADPYKRLHADQLEIDFLFGYCMWSLEGVNGISEETITKSVKIRDRITEELTTHYKYSKNIENYASRTYKLLNLVIALDRIAEMREEDYRMSKVFQLLNVEVHLDDITGDTTD